MDKNLYFIANEGCDDTTCGIARISDEDFPKFKEIIENLNKNSHYGCMPTISVYKIDMSKLKEIKYNTESEYLEDDSIDIDDIFYLDGKIYTFAEQYFNYWNLECVINADR